MTATAIDVLAYINEHYIGIDELCKLSGTSRERIEELVATRCIPPHSYELNLQATKPNSAAGLGLGSGKSTMPGIF